MPSVIQAAGVWLLSVGVPASVINFAWGFAISVTLSVISSKLFGPKIPQMGSELGGKSILKRSGVEYRNIVYGKAATSGPIIYQNVNGSDAEYLTTAIALCHGEIESLESVWFGNEEIPVADISWSTSPGGAAGSGTGAVSTAAWVGDDSTTAVNIYWTLGHADQVAMTQLTSFIDFTTLYRARGVPLLVVRLLYDAKTERIWQSGVPGSGQNIMGVVKGRKLYDCRLDSSRIIDSTTSPITYGAGLHDIDDNTTWTWSDNPALCVADYLINIMNVDATSINWESIASAADDCDVSVVIDAASPQATETRFTCNGVLSLGSSHKENLDTLLSSMDGKLSYSGGTWKVRASVWEASSVSYDADDLAGNLDVRGSAPRSERFNTVRGVFVDPSRNYKTTEFPIVTNTNYVTRDGGKTLYRDLALPMTNSATMAQRIGFRLIEQGDNQIILKAKLNHRGAKCTVGDVVTWDLPALGWDASSSPITSKTFRVIEWSPVGDGSYDITFKEDYSASYDDPGGADYTDGNTGTVTVPAEVVPPPTGLSASSVPYGIRLNWTNPAADEFDYIDVYASSTSSWSDANRAGSVRTDTYRLDVGIDVVRYFWIRARRNNGDVSTRLPDSDTSTTSGTGGGSASSVSLAGATLSNTTFGSTAEVGYRLTTGGEEQSYEGTASPLPWARIDDWLIEGSAGNYYVQLNKTSGTSPTSGPALASKHVLSSTREWIWSDTVSGGGVISFAGTVELYDNSSPQALLASADLTVSIENQVSVVTLSGHQVDAYRFAADATAYLKVDQDGNVYQKVNTGSYTQIDTATNWARPTTEAPGSYVVRYTGATGDTGDLTCTTSQNTWHAMSSSDWIISILDTDGATGGPSATFTIEIADGNSPQVVLDSASYTLVAEREDGP